MDLYLLIAGISLVFTVSYIVVREAVRMYFNDEPEVVTENKPKRGRPRKKNVNG